MRKLLTILNANAKKSDGVATGGGAAWLNLKTVAETFYWCSKRRAARMSLLCRWHTTRMDRLCRANTYFINKLVPFLSLQGYCLGQLPIVSCYTDAGARVNAVQCSARTGGRIGAEGRSRATHCACHRAGCLHITSSPDHRPPDAVFPRTTALITNCRDGLHRGRSRTY